MTNSLMPYYFPEYLTILRNNVRTHFMRLNEINVCQPYSKVCGHGRYSIGGSSWDWSLMTNNYIIPKQVGTIAVLKL